MLLESEVFLKGPHMDLCVDDSLTLNSSARAAAQMAPETYREELNCLALGQGLEGQLSPKHEHWKSYSVPLLIPSPTCEGRRHISVSINLANTVCPVPGIP